MRNGIGICLPKVSRITTIILSISDLILPDVSSLNTSHIRQQRFSDDLNKNITMQHLYIAKLFITVKLNVKNEVLK